MISTTVANSPLFWLAVIGGLAGLYVLPSVIAACRKAEGLGWIIVLNVLPTGVGWLAALVLAFAMPRRDPPRPCRTPIPGRGTGRDGTTEHRRHGARDAAVPAGPARPGVSPAPDGTVHRDTRGRPARHRGLAGCHGVPACPGFPGRVFRVTTLKEAVPDMTTEITELSNAQAAVAELIDALDLEPVVVKLIRPEPGVRAMRLADADERIAWYRGFLKLCAWYPGESVVPSTAIDQAWHTHILDTGKYAADCDTVFGYFLHHFPYLGMRGPDDVSAWHAAYARTRELFRAHFGIDLPAGEAAGTCHNGGSSCKDSGGSICSNEECEKSATGTIDLPRPRPDRTASPVLA